MGIQHGIDGVSASSVFLMTDGLTGGIIGLIISLLGGGYSAFPVSYIILGLVSGTLAGTGVLCLNVALMEGLAGPAVAMANLSSVIQTFLDWGFLGQVPSLLEGLGLIIAVLGAIIMAIGDDYVLKPLILSKLSKTVKEKEDKEDDIEMNQNNSGTYKNPEIKEDNHSKNRKFLEGKNKNKVQEDNGKKGSSPDVLQKKE